MNSLARFTEQFGTMMSRALLTVLYYVVLGPFALLYRAFSDPLHLRRRKNGNWSAWRGQADTLSAARRQD